MVSKTSTPITLYFIFSTDKNIKVIPITLCILVFGISTGPWGAFSVSRKSQTNRLLKVVRTNGMINADQKIVPASKPFHSGDAKQIRSIIEYLIDENGYHDHSLQPLFATNLDSIIAEKKDKYIYGHYWEAEQLTEYLRIDQFDADGPEYTINGQQHNINAEPQLLGISEFEYLIPGYHGTQYEGDSDYVSSPYSLGGRHLMVTFYRKTGIVCIVGNGDSTISLNLQDFVSRLNPDRHANTYRQDSLTLSGENRTLATKFIFKELNVNVQKDSAKLMGFDADILLHFKKP